MFGFRLRVPARGDDITADWARELVKAVRSLRLQAGPGIRLTRTPEGTTISAAPAEASPKPAAIHFGATEAAEERASWSIAEGIPAILSLGGEGDESQKTKVLVDSRGNVVAWNYTKPPPCGNPLNEESDYHPLNVDSDYHPLDHEGDGGYTPLCFGDDQ